MFKIDGKNVDEKLFEKHIQTKKVFSGQMLNMYVDTVLLPNDKKATREYVKHPGAVAILPILPDGKIVFVRQYRYPVQKVLYELPAGKLDIGELPENCALRELREETGYVANKLEKLTSIFTVPAFCDEVIHIYKASDLLLKTKQFDEDEFVETVLLDKIEIKKMINDGLICDAKTLVGLSFIGIMND